MKSSSRKSSPCSYDKSTSLTWEDAMKECNGRGARLITVSDISKCPTGAVFDGTYWIGTYRDSPYSITSASGPADTSTVSSTRTPRSRGTSATNASTVWTYANNTTHSPSTLAAADSSGEEDDTMKIAISKVQTTASPIFIAIDYHQHRCYDKEDLKRICWAK
ncbi:hypothetical protein CHS0354_027310 [Potamilus streckersoni]|uniref:C-type lectin domain-containing protein n=1 Tax=Potamilus streckersoni TaxID=2493646 RepID=A0AAE0TEJ8_9BIVA|nr:hypothetical protein CHS0354_027310 [Potamilus streckersoni]